MRLRDDNRMTFNPVAESVAASEIIALSAFIPKGAHCGRGALAVDEHSGGKDVSFLTIHPNAGAAVAVHVLDPDLLAIDLSATGLLAKAHVCSVGTEIGVENLTSAANRRSRNVWWVVRHDGNERKCKQHCPES